MKSAVAWLLLSLNAGVPGAPGAAPQTGSGVFRVGGDVRAPVLLSKTEPEYTDEARASRLQGRVILYAQIGENGQARNLNVVKSLGLGLDQNAIAAVTTWRFQPGAKGDRPVVVECTIEVLFRLLGTNRHAWYLGGGQFTLPPGGSRPRVLHARFTKPSGVPEDVSARVAFDVDSQGKAGNIHVAEASDPGVSDKMFAMIRDWRFQAATVDGAPVAAHAQFDFVRGQGAALKQR